MTTDKTTEERVIQIVSRVFHKDVSAITRETRFIEDLFAKSVNVLELTAILEYEFNIPMIPLARARKAKTVGEAIDLVASLL